MLVNSTMQVHILTLRVVLNVVCKYHLILSNLVRVSLMSESVIWFFNNK